MGKAKILFLNSSSDLYGSSRIFLEVIRLCRNAGLTAVVVLPGAGPLFDLLREEGFQAEIQNLGILRRKYLNPFGLLNRLGKSVSALNFMNKLHREHQFDLVYSNTLAVAVGAYWARKKGIAHVWHIHEILSGPKTLVYLLSKLLDHEKSFPIAVSEAVKTNWEGRLKKTEPEVIHNGIPYSEFLEERPDARESLGLPQDQVVITMIGRINPGKGQLFFLEMASRLSKKYKQVSFLMVGNPYPGYEKLQNEMTSFIEEQKLEGRVFDLGFRRDIPAILQASSIFVLPSILPDSFPTVILEAMASGKPVVATRSGGAEELLIDGATGFLINVNDVEAGVDALSRLIESPELRDKMGKAGREKVLREFSLEAFEEKITKKLWRILPKS